MVGAQRPGRIRGDRFGQFLCRAGTCYATFSLLAIAGSGNAHRSGAPAPVRSHLSVAEDVQNLAAWFAHEEAADAPRLIREWMEYLVAHSCGCGMRSIDVVYLYRNVWLDRRAGVPLHHADLRRRIVRRDEGHDPTLIHRYLKA
jgi:hypothetical protein